MTDAAIAVAAGLAAGALSGLLGVGGGVLMVPAMVILLDRTQHVAEGTSLLVMIATAIAGTRANRRRGLLDRRAAILLGAAGVFGAVAGALVALRVVGEAPLGRIFGGFLIVVAARTFWPRRRETEPGDRPAPP